MVLAQINRGVESQGNKRPGMADIKDSGDIEQDMDLGLLLYRDEYSHILHQYIKTDRVCSKLAIIA